MDEELKALVKEQLLQIKALRCYMDAVEKTCEAMSERIGLSSDNRRQAEPIPDATPPKISDQVKAVFVSGETADMTDHGTRDIASTEHFGLKDAIIEIATKSSRALSFDDIYTQLQNEASAMLPSEKPKLHVRRILYRKDIFSLRHGLFFLNPSLKPAEDKASGAESEGRPRAQGKAEDAVLVLDGGAQPMDRRATGIPASDATPAPTPRPRPRLPREDHFTRRLEDILGTNTRFHIDNKESS